MKRIDTLILDYGGVISLPITQSTLEELYSLAVSGKEDIIDKESFLKIYYSERADFDRGLVDSNLYWKGIADKLKLKLSLATITKLARIDLKGWATFSKPMLEAIDSLNSSGIDLVLLSNMSFDMKEYLKKYAKWPAKFKKLILSCDLKLIKPDPEIYYETLKISGKDSSQVLFADDTMENIVAAREAGIRSLHFKDSEKDIAEIFSFLETM